MDASDGLPVTTIDDAACEMHFGCTLEGLPRKLWRLIVVRAGGRGGKSSRLLAPKALHAAWTVPAPELNPGEDAFAFIVAPYADLADQTFAFVRGYAEASPILSAALLGEPKARSLRLRRPDGTIACVKVVAAGGRGTQLRARTPIFCGIDEAALFRDRASGVVNDEHIYGAIAPRIIAGGQCWMVSTPWLANVGLIEQTIGREWGTHEHALCVVAPTKALRPTFDPDGKIEAAERSRDPDNWEREILAIPLTGGTGAFFSPEAVEAMFDDGLPQRLEHDTSKSYGAGADTGFRLNSSALSIVEKSAGSEADRARFRLALLEERKPLPGLPLEPEKVSAEFADLAADYGVRQIVVDSHERSKVTEALLAKNASAVNAPDKLESFMLARTIVHSGRFKAPPNPRLRQQLLAVLAKPMPGGGVQITSPRRIDGSHGDLVSALVNALWIAHRTDGDGSGGLLRIRSHRR